MALRSLSLCAGIGGIDIGLAPWLRTACYVERDDFAARVLRSRIADGSLDDAPIWDDVRTFDARAWRGRADALVAGFPCQPHSTASRGRRVAFDLWPDVRERVRELGPALVFLENVQRAPIERAAVELRELGYRCDFTANDAAELGAAHRRVRWWLLAHSDDAEQPALALDGEVAGLPPLVGADEWSRGPGALLGMDARLPGRMDRLRALGNAVVPARARAAFVQLARRVLT